MDVREMGWECVVDSMHLVQYRDQWRADCCEHGNDPSDSVKSGEFLDQLCEHLLVMKNSSPWS
jgi:hypothetical protein